jgi:hypothetical protein
MEKHKSGVFGAGVGGKSFCGGMATNMTGITGSLMSILFSTLVYNTLAAVAAS